MTRKSHVAPHFDHLDSRNALMPLILLLASYNVDASTNGVTCPLFCTSFQLPWPKEYNGAVGNTIGITLHWCQHYWHHITKVVIMHIISVVSTYEMQCYHWCCRWHHMKLMELPLPSKYEKVILHLILIT